MNKMGKLATGIVVTGAVVSTVTGLIMIVGTLKAMAAARKAAAGAAGK